MKAQNPTKKRDFEPFAFIVSGKMKKAWYNNLTANSIFFVTRLKTNADVEHLLKRAGRKCVFLMLAYLKYKAKLGTSMQQILRLLQLNLFARRDLIELFKPPSSRHTVFPQILLCQKLLGSADSVNRP